MCSKERNFTIGLWEEMSSSVNTAANEALSLKQDTLILLPCHLGHWIASGCEQVALSSWNISSSSEVKGLSWRPLLQSPTPSLGVLQCHSCHTDISHSWEILTMETWLSEFWGDKWSHAKIKNRLRFAQLAADRARSLWPVLASKPWGYLLPLTNDCNWLIYRHLQYKPWTPR